MRKKILSQPHNSKFGLRVSQPLKCTFSACLWKRRKMVEKKKISENGQESISNSFGVLSTPVLQAGQNTQHATKTIKQ